MKVLGIDTSGMSASAAVLTASTLGIAAATEPRAHARVLPDLIVAAARDAGSDVDAVTHVAVARGPGMFTGMRVGLVAAQMYAMARGLDLAGVSTLQACAHRVLARHSPDRTFAVAVDARRREVFLQAFGPAAEPIGPVTAVPVNEVSAAADALDAVLFVDASMPDVQEAGVPLDLSLIHI